MAKLATQTKLGAQSRAGRKTSEVGQWNKSASSIDDAHQVLVAHAASLKTVTYDQIWAGLTHALNPSDPKIVAPGDSISTYVSGGVGVVDGFVNVLNGSPPFSFHHMNLVPGDVKFKSSVLAWANTIKNWYEKHGFKVVE